MADGGHAKTVVDVIMMIHFSTFFDILKKMIPTWLQSLYDQAIPFYWKR